MALRIVASSPHPDLLTLPWHLPLEEWEGPFMVGLPRGLSRHVVRFVRVNQQVCASTGCCATCVGSTSRRSSPSAW